MKPEQTNFAKGMDAEEHAAEYMLRQGYEVLARRYKTKGGEIDLIARRKKQICFVEVKVRQTETEALEAVTPRTQKRIEAAALYFISMHPEYADCDMRFDVIAITRPFKILHLDNAWEARS
jgi:putative endonuclease